MATFIQIPESGKKIKFIYDESFPKPFIVYSNPDGVNKKEIIGQYSTEKSLKKSLINKYNIGSILENFNIKDECKKNDIHDRINFEYSYFFMCPKVTINGRTITFATVVDLEMWLDNPYSI